MVLLFLIFYFTFFFYHAKMEFIYHQRCFISHKAFDESIISVFNIIFESVLFIFEFILLSLFPF